VLPILTTAQMREADARAVASRGVDALVTAAGTAVGLEVQRCLGRCYGARVAVVVGPGLNGADGRVAAAWLRGRGAKVDVIAVADQPATLAGYELVVDAAFGLGCSRPYAAPALAPGTTVVAVDLPSGVDADSGDVLGAPLAADVTVALGAFKYAHLTGDAAALAGEVRFAGLGIVGEFTDAVMENADLATLVHRSPQDHKWSHAVQAFAGSPHMPGAAGLVARGALAGGASMIRLSTRGDVTTLADLPPEVVRADAAGVDARCRAVAAGPGLGPDAASWLGELLAGVEVPVVLDADGLDRSLVAAARSRWIITPHAGEFARLSGAGVPADRIGAARALARDLGCVVLLKGPTTVLADPAGTVRVVRSGTAALATAGTGDVLTGLIAATIARGHDPLEAGALAAHLHGLAGAQLDTYAPASDVALDVASILHRLQRLEWLDA